MSFRAQVLKFLVVGGTNFWLTMAIFLAALNWLQFHYLLALLTSWFLGMLFTYTWNYIWVFKPSERFQFGRNFVKYLLAGSASIGLNLVALRFLVENWEIDPFWTQMALIPFIVIFNFLTAKFWSLRHGKSSL
ncbi:GtrA family protein [Ruegeria arenilitoris]|uniref:GtrA family protein n=1 Tax=Ruegeria arenilitoris TaxID=1173585 RepID=UPI0014814711|nr:GtrA family protein [Ruegeria arenilitoris]